MKFIKPLRCAIKNISYRYEGKNVSFPRLVNLHKHNIIDTSSMIINARLQLSHGHKLTN